MPLEALNIKIDLEPKDIEDQIKVKIILALCLHQIIIVP